jgi:hypothetical protein
MSEFGSRQKYVRFQALITRAHRAFLEQDADDRYPPNDGQKRNLSPALRDMLDFTEANYPLFLTWIASRGNLPPQA